MQKTLASSLTRIYPAVLLTLVLFGVLLSGYREVVRNTQSDALDQGAYLTIGLAVREDGRLTDPNRQPLFSWMLAPFARRELSYFTWAKLVTLATAALTVLGAYGLAARLSRNRTVGLCVAFLVAANRAFLYESGTVMVEPLLALFTMLIWYVGLRALETDRGRYWVLGGLLTGLGFLAKEPAALWAPAWTVGAAFTYRLKARSYLKWLAFAALALLIVSPTFLHNLRSSGALVSTGNVSAIWMDDWEQFFAVGPEAQLSMTQFLQTHSLSSIANRVFDGIYSFALLAVSIFLPILPLARWLGIRALSSWLGWTALGIGIVLAACYFRPAWRYCREQGRFVAFTVTFLGLHVLLMAWFTPVTYDERYVTPLLPMGYTILAGAALYFARYTLEGHPQALARLGRGATVVLVAAILWWCGSVAADFRGTNVFASDERANRVQAAFVQKLGGIAREATIVHGPSHGLPVWLIEGPSRIISVPSNVDGPRFAAYMQGERARFLVMTPELYLRRLNLFNNLWYPAWPDTKSYVVENGRPLGIRILPASWDLALAQDNLPSPTYAIRVGASLTGVAGTRMASGDAAVVSGEWERAANEYTAALGLVHGDTSGLERALGQLALIRGQDEAARGHFDQAIVQQPQNPWYRSLRGDLLAATGDLAGAAADYTAAAGSGWANVQASLGWIEEQQGNMQPALAYYRQALQLAPDNPWYEARLGRALAAAGLPEEAARHFETAGKQSPRWAFLNDWRDAVLPTAANPAAKPSLHPLNVRYPNGPVIKGYHIDTGHVDRDGVVDLVLRWTPSSNAARTERAYAKLLNAVYSVWGEGNADLRRQGVPSGPWAQDIELEQTVEIPVRPGTPPGSYPITLDMQSVTGEAWLQPTGVSEVKAGPVELPRVDWKMERLDLTGQRAATLDGRVRLLGYRLDGEARPGQTLTLTLFWQVADRLPARYTVFTHLTDEAGRLRAQKDNEPADGFYPTDAWVAGQIVRDPYPLTIPTDAPPGEYTLQAGMYSPATGQRLTATGDDAAPQGDAILVATVSVR